MLCITLALARQFGDCPGQRRCTAFLVAWGAWSEAGQPLRWVRVARCKRDVLVYSTRSFSLPSCFTGLSTQYKAGCNCSFT